MSSPPSVSKPTGPAPNGKPAGQRLHTRLSIQRQVRLSWEDRQGTRILQARAIDISRFGLLVETEKAIPPGTLVTVQTTSAFIGRACVRHCTPKGARYRVGLHLPDRMLREL
jgi:hypothetical protein